MSKVYQLFRLYKTESTTFSGGVPYPIILEGDHHADICYVVDNLNDIDMDVIKRAHDKFNVDVVYYIMKFIPSGSKPIFVDIHELFQDPLNKWNVNPNKVFCGNITELTTFLSSRHTRSQ